MTKITWSYVPVLMMMRTDIGEKESSFADNLRFKTLHADLLPSMQDAGMMETINMQSFHTFTRNTWIGDLGASCHITNDNMGLYVVTNIETSVANKLGKYNYKKR